jgi:hypothetical protein
MHAILKKQTAYCIILGLLTIGVLTFTIISLSRLN